MRFGRESSHYASTSEHLQLPSVLSNNLQNVNVENDDVLGFLSIPNYDFEIVTFWTFSQFQIMISKIYRRCHIFPTIEQETTLQTTHA